jgi:hypothetical protein
MNELEVDNEDYSNKFHSTHSGPMDHLRMPSHMTEGDIR